LGLNKLTWALWEIAAGCILLGGGLPIYMRLPVLIWQPCSTTVSSGCVTGQNLLQVDKKKPELGISRELKILFLILNRRAKIILM